MILSTFQVYYMFCLYFMQLDTADTDIDVEALREGFTEQKHAWKTDFSEDMD